jgi:threonine/homoserine/homoserine lactone efflux protein
MPIFLRGLLIGISIAAPVGPIGILCIRRTLAEGRLSGFISGMGAASADAIYGVVAGFGLTLIAEFLVAQQQWMSLIGGFFLCYLGIRTFLSSPSYAAPPLHNEGLLRNYLSIFFLTLTNPMTILSFAAIFAGLGLAEKAGDYASAGLLVLGVFSGSALWWLTLSFGVSSLRERVTLRWMLWINRLSGGIVFAFGIAAWVNYLSLV